MNAGAASKLHSADAVMYASGRSKPRPYEEHGKNARTSAKARGQRRSVSRSAEALLPPHECGGCYPKAGAL